MRSLQFYKSIYLQMMLKTVWQSKSHLTLEGRTLHSFSVWECQELVSSACLWGEPRGSVSSVVAALLSCCDSSQGTCHQAVQLHVQQLREHRPSWSSQHRGCLSRGANKSLECWELQLKVRYLFCRLCCDVLIPFLVQNIYFLLYLVFSFEVVQ